MKKIVLSMMVVILTASLCTAAGTQKKSDDFNYELAIETVSPFCMAIIKGDLETVKKMIEYGSDIDRSSKDMTPLMYAARHNRVNILKLLIDKGAKTDTKNSKGDTAVKLAKRSNAIDALKVLEELS